MKRTVTLFFVSALMAALAGCGASGGTEKTPSNGTEAVESDSEAKAEASEAEPEEAPEKEVLNVIYHPTIGGSTAVATAINQGFFEKENLDVRLQMYTSGPPEIAAMVAGQADIGFIGSGAAWLAFSGQVDIIALDNIALTEQIVTRADSGIESISDLKGKTIAVQEGAAGYTLLMVALQANDMTVNDVKVLNISNDNIPSTYKDSSIDVWAGWKPATNSLQEALGENCKVLADNVSYPDYAFPSVWVANKEYVAQHPDVVQRFVNALTKAEIYRAENENQACAYASTYAQQPTNDLTAQLPDVIFPTAEQFKEYYTTDAFAKMLENLKSTQAEKVEGNLTIQDIYKDTFVKTAVSELVN